MYLSDQIQDLLSKALLLIDIVKKMSFLHICSELVSRSIEGNYLIKLCHSEEAEATEESP